MAPEYIKAVYSIQSEGDITGVVPSRFGYHIIRLEEIKPAHYRTFEEAKPDIAAELEQEYRELSAKAFDSRYRISDQAYINGPAMEQIFAPYKAGAGAPAAGTPAAGTPAAGKPAAGSPAAGAPGETPAAEK